MFTTTAFCRCYLFGEISAIEYFAPNSDNFHHINGTLLSLFHFEHSETSELLIFVSTSRWIAKFFVHLYPGYKLTEV